MKVLPPVFVTVALIWHNWPLANTLYFKRILVDWKLNEKDDRLRGAH